MRAMHTSSWIQVIFGCMYLTLGKFGGQAQLVRLDRPVCLEQMVWTVNKVQSDLSVPKVFRVNRALLVLVDHRANQACKVFRAFKVPQGTDSIRRSQLLRLEQL